MKIEVIGVYLVSANEPCHLVEIWVRKLHGELKMDDFTQVLEDRRQDSWQVPYDERVLDKDGKSQVGKQSPRSISSDGSDVRLAFFFHYLDFAKPLLTPAGPLQLPEETMRPSRLVFFEYDSPC